MLAISLALGSSLAWGISDFLGGVKSRAVPLLGVLLVSQGAALVLLAGVVASLGDGPPGGSFLLYAALAGLAETVGVAALYRGLAVGVMSIVAPVAATAPLVPVAVGIALGELPSPIQAAGIALTAVSVFVVAILVTRSGVAMRRADVPVIVAIGLLVIAGDAMYATASTHGLLSVVAVLSTLYPVVTIALARAFLAERIDPRQRIGIAMCLGGVVAISAG